jgi:hypothetical protein
LRVAQTQRAATPQSPTTAATIDTARSAMYGRRPRCKRNLTFPRCGRVRSCIRPIVAATLAAGHDVIRGSGPNQGAALINRMALHGFSRSNGSTVSHQRRHHPLQILDASLTWPILYFFIAEPLTFNLPLRETVRLADVHGRSPSWSAPPRRCAPSY